MNASLTASQLFNLVRQRLNRETVLCIIFIVELVIFGLIIPNYLTVWGLLDTSRSFVEAGLMALGMTLVIISGGIDLSVASLLALVSVVIGFSFKAGVPLPLALVFGVVVGMLGGTFNGAMVAFLNLHPLVVTLGTLALFRGVAYAISKANAVSNFPGWFTFFGQSYVMNLVPVQLFFFVALTIVIWLLLSKTAFGRYVYGIGNNELTTRFSGIRTWRVKLAVYTLTGFLVSIAGIIHTSRIFTSRANAAMGLELTVIATVVLGGTKITGGSGSITGTLFGVLILTYLQDGLFLAGVRNDWGLIVTGVFLISGVFFNEFFRKERGNS